MAIHTVGIIGAGIMGSGIAQVAAGADIDVILVDVSEVALGLDRFVAKGKLAAAEKDAALGRITRSIGYEALRPADPVIEAAPENLDLKTRALKTDRRSAGSRRRHRHDEHLLRLDHQVRLGHLPSGALHWDALLQPCPGDAAGRDLGCCPRTVSAVGSLRKKGVGRAR